MTQLEWDKAGERLYETGTSHGVLYLADSSGAYIEGFAWNGLVSVTQSPTGAESTKQYADNIVYVNLISVEEFAATIEAFTYPDEFEQCDGSATPVPGVSVGQQTRRPFGFSYQSLIGNDTLGTDFGFKVHLVYGAQAGVSERGHTTVNDSPEAATMSWEVTTTPVAVGTGLKPTARLTIDSTKVDADALETLLEILYGTEGTDPRLPLPAEVIALFNGTVIAAVPTAPAYDPVDDEITIPTITGVVYTVNGEVVTGTVENTGRTIVRATPAAGYKFVPPLVTAWQYDV